MLPGVGARSRLIRDLILIGVSALGALAASAGLLQWAETAGLECADYANARWEGPAYQTRIERDFAMPRFATAPSQSHTVFSTECRGLLAVSEPAHYRVMLVTRANTMLWIDDRPVAAAHGPRLQRAHGSLDLTAGQHPLRVRYAGSGGVDDLEVLMARGSGPLRPLNGHRLSLRPTPLAMVPLRGLARPAAIAVPLLWLCLAVYRLRMPLLAAIHGISPSLMHIHRLLTANVSRSLVIVIAVAVLARLVMTLGTYPILWPDSAQYYETALSYLKGDFLSHNILSTPLFPAFMAAFLAVDVTPAAGAAMIAVQRLLAVAATFGVYHLARLAFDRTVAFYAALLWTLSVVQLYYETVVATEAFFVVVLIATVVVAARMLRTDSPAAAALTGVMCAVATLTRPVAKALVFIVLAIVWWRGRERRRLVLASVVLLATFTAGIVPWMYVNRQTYGFWGVSRGEGLWLFLRVFDIDELEPAPETRYPAVRDVHDAVKPSFSYLHYVVRDELNYRRGYSAAQADEAMFGFALEAALAHPGSFAAGTLEQWTLLLVNPYRSVQTCESAGVRHLCSERGREMSFRAFPNRPTAGFAAVKSAVAAYERAAYWVVPLLVPFAVIGMVRLVAERGSQTGLRVLFAVTVLYLTLATALFNTVQDRYRLPADAFLVMFAVHELRRLAARVLRAADRVAASPPAS